MRSLLTDDLFLLAHDCEVGKPPHDFTFGFGLGGALLADLLLDGRIWIDGELMVAVDRGPTGDALVDTILPCIAGTGLARPADEWITRLRANVPDMLAGRLVGQGRVRRVRARHGLLGYTYRCETVDLAHVRFTRGHLRAVLRGAEPADLRSAALACLLRATELERVLLSPLSDRKVSHQIDRLTAMYKPMIGVLESAVSRAMVAAVVARPSRANR